MLLGPLNKALFFMFGIVVFLVLCLGCSSFS